MEAELTIPGLLQARAEAEPDRAAIVVDGRGELTFGAWASRSNAVAHGLLDRGLRPGDRVGLRFGGARWIDYAVAYCGVQKAGGVAVPLAAAQPVRVTDDILDRCDAVGVLQEDTGCAAGPGRWAATIEEVESADDTPPGIEVSPSRLAQIVYTSGTTGDPKGVAASHANLTYGRHPMPRRRAYAHSRHFLHAFPIGTNAAQMMLMDALTAYPAALALPRFDAAEFCRLVEAYRVGTVFLVPSMAIELLGSAARRRQDLSSVVLVGSSAAALPPALAQDLAAAFPGAVLVNTYTSTEAMPAGTTMVLDPERPGSLGRASDPGDLVIRDSGGRVLPPGEVGEVWLRCPAPPRSYFADPGGSAAVFRDGWVRMGDVGHLDDAGYLYLADRAGDVIKSGALKVSTLRVEAALHEHPLVAEAAVVGVPHPVMGEVPSAAVRLRGHVRLEELRDFLTTRLARHELPTRIAVVDDFARNEAGKVLKPAVRALFTGASTRVPLTAAQLADLAGDPSPHESALRVHDPLDLAALRRALADLAARHDALRMTFPGGGVAEIADGLAPDLERVEGGTAALTGALRAAFDARRGPLLRAVVAETPDGGRLLGLAAYPLVCDAWSLDLLVQELGILYGAAYHGRPAGLPPVETTYAGFVTAAHAGSGAPTPVTRPGPVFDTGPAEWVPVVIAAGTVGRLRRAARARGTAPGSLALVAWASALAEEHGSACVLVRSPGRTTPGAAGLVGPLGVDIPGLPEQVVEAADAEAHRFRPVPPHAGRFTFEGLRPEPDLPGLRTEPLPLPAPTPPHGPPRLTLTAQPDGSLSGHCEGRSAARAAESFTHHLGLLLS
ncbi:AMP-binding protein [Nonomuraea bangladeshensis]|uniref:AMP-binding protein n=1 Tax=Nonomuraea bangladeshensis TaxID=404385 RepID=UPI0031D7B6D6